MVLLRKANILLKDLVMKLLTLASWGKDQDPEQ
jgi:hypothetical protein